MSSNYSFCVIMIMIYETFSNIIVRILNENPIFLIIQSLLFNYYQMFKHQYFMILCLYYSVYA